MEAATAQTDGTRPLTIGAVCRRLREEFPDISISKIRYLEDQGLLTPRRTQGGYRLFAEEDVERLETILRLQRDEFLPLRVIRQELSSGAHRRERASRAGLRAPEAEIDLETLCERAGVDGAFGASAREPTARQGCWSRSSRPRFAPRTRSGAMPASRSSRRSRPSPRSSRTSSSGARFGLSFRVSVPLDLASKIRDIPDFPKRGIVFKDIMPLLADPDALHETVEQLAAFAEPRKPEVVLGAEARGFILGAALAYRLNCGFIAARKPGKLPWRTVSAKYALEYGFDALELHADAIRKGQRVLVHDDVLATGGTAKAKCELVEQLGGEVVGVEFIISLEFLNGREKLAGYDVHSLIQY